VAWIESHQELENHPKLMKLCSISGMSTDEAIGRLHRLWWWALKYAEDGDLSKYEPSQILVGLNSNIDPEKFFKMLKDTNFIEKSGIIHDWLEYSGRYFTAKYRTSNPKKLNKIQRKNKSVLSRTKVCPKSDNQPNQPNQPNLTNHNISEQVKNLFNSFDDNIKNKVDVYLNRVAKGNKSGVITIGRKRTLMLELINSKDRCNNDDIFGYALDQTIDRDACCIGYVNAVIKNRKTEKPR